MFRIPPWNRSNNTAPTQSSEITKMTLTGELKTPFSIIYCILPSILNVVSKCLGLFYILTASLAMCRAETLCQKNRCLHGTAPVSVILFPSEDRTSGITQASSVALGSPIPIRSGKDRTKRSDIKSVPGPLSQWRRL